MVMFWRGLSNGGKIDRDFRPICGFYVDDCSSVECRQQFRQWNNLQHQAAAPVYRADRRDEAPHISESCL